MYGLDVSRNIIDECSKGGYHVEQLLVSNVTKDFDLMPIQCGLLCYPNTFGCKVAQILFSPIGIVKIGPKGTYHLLFRTSERCYLCTTDPTDRPDIPSASTPKVVSGVPALSTSPAVRLH